MDSYLEPWALSIRALLCAICLLLLGVNGDGPELRYADTFIRLTKEHRFKEAAKTFFYPPNYTSQRLEREETTVGEFLESLFKVAGDLRDEAPGAPEDAAASWRLGISATDGPVGASDIGADKSEVMYYHGRFANEGQASVALFLVHVRGRWWILRFDFRVPRSATVGPDEFAEFSRKVFLGCRACQPGKEI